MDGPKKSFDLFPLESVNKDNFMQNKDKNEIKTRDIKGQFQKTNVSQSKAKSVAFEQGRSP